MHHFVVDGLHTFQASRIHESYLRVASPHVEGAYLGSAEPPSQGNLRNQICGAPDGHRGKHTVESNGWSSPSMTPPKFPGDGGVDGVGCVIPARVEP